jgi:hypothetical protein
MWGWGGGVGSLETLVYLWVEERQQGLQGSAVRAGRRWAAVVKVVIVVMSSSNMVYLWVEYGLRASAVRAGRR